MASFSPIRSSILSARNLVFSNSTISVTNFLGSLILNVTNSLADTGGGANNQWLTTAGFTLARRPASGDLLGTELISQPANLPQVTHVWPEKTAA